MLFSSPIFLFLFLPAVLFGYFLIFRKIPNLFLLIASLFFYAWGEGIYIGYILLIVLANYIFGLLIWSKKNKRFWLAVGIIFNVGVLFYFKYLVFFVTNFLNLTNINIQPNFSFLHMPLGISFVTFHVISYIFDVYRQKIKVEKNLLDLMLYVFLFPHLIAGPIVRYKDTGHQIKSRTINLASFNEGVDRFVYGLGKKVILANGLGKIADKIFILFPHQLSPELVWIGLIAFGLQIYFDFSGYSDMAIGLARMFGFKFAENFNYPYISTSIQDFWRRWHMTLSSWFRDYVYIPLGGSRAGQFRLAINILIVFGLTGFWHGASWNFLVWGLYFGAFLILERIMLKNIFDKIWLPYRYLYTLMVVFVGWLFFRVESLAYAFFLLKVLFGIENLHTRSFSVGTILTTEAKIILIFSLIAATPILAFIFRRYRERCFSLFALTNIILMVVIFVYSVMHLASDTYNPFIYFRF